MRPFARGPLHSRQVARAGSGPLRGAGQTGGGARNAPPIRAIWLPRPGGIANQRPGIVHPAAPTERRWPPPGSCGVPLVDRADADPLRAPAGCRSGAGGGLYRRGRATGRAVRLSPGDQPGRSWAACPDASARGRCEDEGGDRIRRTARRRVRDSARAGQDGTSEQDQAAAEPGVPPEPDDEHMMRRVFAPPAPGAAGRTRPGAKLEEDGIDDE